MYRVTMTACTAGNPLKAWRGTTGEDDTEHVPDDVWEDVSFEFDDLDAAKDYIRGLSEQMTTHVALFADEEMIFDQDAGNDHLDDAAPGVEPPHLAAAPVSADEIVEPAPFLPPGGAK